MDKQEIFDRAFVSAMRSIPEDYEERSDTREIERAVFYGVQLMSRESDPKTVENLHQQFRVVEGVMGMMTFLTPRKFVEIFPITKEYDGKRWGTKDYFYTVEMIEEHGWDKLISRPDNFLWEYVNLEVSLFMVKYLSLASEIRQSQGKLGLMEEWAAMNNIRTYSLQTGPDGKQYVLDPRGRTLPLSKPRPKHLKLVDARRAKRNE
ncbi:hypothetical protein D3C81_633390 [compost metagenome]